MALQGWRPRNLAVDVAVMLALFAGASVVTGRVWRSPFDDELLTHNVAARSPSLAEFAGFFLNGGDVHPPLAFVILYGLMKAGVADWGLRLFSLAMTGLSLALFHLLSLMWAGQRHGVSPLLRWSAVLLFGLCPMAISQGDALH